MRRPALCRQAPVDWHLTMAPVRRKRGIRLRFAWSSATPRRAFPTARDSKLILAVQRRAVTRTGKGGGEPSEFPRGSNRVQRAKYSARPCHQALDCMFPFCSHISCRREFIGGALWPTLSTVWDTQKSCATSACRRTKPRRTRRRPGISSWSNSQQGPTYWRSRPIYRRRSRSFVPVLANFRLNFVRRNGSFKPNSVRVSKRKACG
jgi:hypothetical protein